nr:hypothetical protein [Tanacetum cinerariifolium]
EDLNLKYLRSLLSEGNTHVVVWRNKPDLDTMSIDNLYNNFKIVEQEVKGTASSNSRSQNMAFVSYPSTNSTNEVHTAYEVSTASTQSSTTSTQVGIASTQTSTANLSDATVYAFLASQLNSLRLQCYNVVPPSAILVYNKGRCPPPKTNFSYSGLEKVKQPQFESYGPKSCEIKSKNTSEDIPNELKEYLNAPLVKDGVSDNKDCSDDSPVMVEKKTVVPTIAKVEVVRPKQQEKPVKKIVRLKAVNTAKPKAFNTARPSPVVVNAVRANKVNVVKASACWV